MITDKMMLVYTHCLTEALKMISWVPLKASGFCLGLLTEWPKTHLQKCLKGKGTYRQNFNRVESKDRQALPFLLG